MKKVLKRPLPKRLRIYAPCLGKGKVNSIHISFLVLSILLYWSIYQLNGQEYIPIADPVKFVLYPEVQDIKPDLPSPFKTKEGKEYVIAETKMNKYAIVEVTLTNTREICKQLVIDSIDFPHLAKTGLHSEIELNKTKTITGRTLDVITSLAQPTALSQAGFLAADEDIISVLKGDNHIVKKMGLTHPQMAAPLFHVLNMMDTDLALNRWNMAKHQWENIHHFWYHGKQVYVEVEDTKGGQKSIFDDHIKGGFFIKLWRPFSNKETMELEACYSHLTPDALDQLKKSISSINIGEMEPQYIMRYGFYEGHTYWRADPIAISFIFGLKSLEELNQIFKGKLYQVFIQHFKADK